MEGISGSLRRGLKKYWRRMGYQRLNGSDRRRRNKVEELGATGTRRWRRIKMAPKIRIPAICSPKKLVLWVRDAYVRMMLGLAKTMGTGYGGDATSIAIGGFGRAPPRKEYDEKMIIQMYNKSMIVTTQGQLVPRDSAPSNMASSDTACQR
ncbi:uncharacterized protein LOC133302940 [Gastrolobium bilobum]|uniref:uncharacterized protein LOC133302940 n=1 Tax=Gastrolobium bilobum TaxID=150636 RepID=UPI002AB13896|nr:uncharacterized protein LOC133302940 [Gastrolobium bilobum]